MNWQMLEELEADWKMDDELTLVQAMQRLVNARTKLADVILREKRLRKKSGLTPTTELILLYEAAHEKVCTMIDKLDDIMDLMNFLEVQPSVDAIKDHLSKS